MKPCAMASLSVQAMPSVGKLSIFLSLTSISHTALRGTCCQAPTLQTQWNRRWAALELFWSSTGEVVGAPEPSERWRFSCEGTTQGMIHLPQGIQTERKGEEWDNRTEPQWKDNPLRTDLFHSSTLHEGAPTASESEVFEYEVEEMRQRGLPPVRLCVGGESSLTLMGFCLRVPRVR